MVDTPNPAPAAGPDAPTGPGAPELDALDAMMEAARVAATQQAVAEQAPPTTPAPAPESGTGEQPGASTPATPPAGDPSTTTPPETPQTDAQGRPSRRDAARLGEQLTQTEARAKDLESRVQSRDAIDRTILENFSKLALTDAELQDATNRGLAGDREAAQRAQQANGFRALLPPLYQAVQREMLQKFGTDFAGLREMDGMDDARFTALTAATSPIQMLQTMHETGRVAEREAGKARIAALEAEVASLKTSQTARGAQPVAGAGEGAPAPRTLLATLMGPDGLPTDKALELAQRGQLRGADLRGS